MYPIGLVYKSTVSVLKYTNTETNEEFIFPLFIYRIQDLKKIQEIIFTEQYQIALKAYNANMDRHVENTINDHHYVYANKEKKPNLVIEVSLKISEPEPVEVQCETTGSCCIQGGKKRKTITKKKKVKFLKKRKTKVLKKRKTKKRIMK